jgi:hypothetical protein
MRIAHALGTCTTCRYVRAQITTPGVVNSKFSDISARPSRNKFFHKSIKTLKKRKIEKSKKLKNGKMEKWRNGKMENRKQKMKKAIIYTCNIWIDWNCVVVTFVDCLR